MSDFADLQSVLDAEIPMCAQMGIRVVIPPTAEADSEFATAGLLMQMPLDGNQNHQRTAFAGSLNALCTITGWGATYLMLRDLGVEGVIVIRRSTIKYHRPVESPCITAHCHPPDATAREYFRDMLAEKGQAKLDLRVEIATASEEEDRPAVAFQGSYVVTDPASDDLL